MTLFATVIAGWGAALGAVAGLMGAIATYMERVSVSTAMEAFKNCVAMDNQILDGLSDCVFLRYSPITQYGAFSK